MHTLIFGAGPLGSLFAARLAQAGQRVTLLARGQRLADLQEHGIVLEQSLSGEREVVRVDTTAQLAPDDHYDLIIVVMRKNQVLEILPTLAANHASPNILFMMNSATGAAEVAAALGRERVMLGFPLPGGERDGHVIRIVPNRPKHPWVLPIGEVDGAESERLKQVAALLGSMAGYAVEMRSDMEAWLTSHVAIVGPALSAVIYASGIDPQRMAHTPDALILAVRGLKEAIRALPMAGISPTPGIIWLIPFIPEPILVQILRSVLSRPELEASLRGHPAAARDEMQFLANEFLTLVKGAGAATPLLDQLYPYFDPRTPPLPEGSSQIAMDWRGLWGLGAGAVVALGLVGVLLCSHRRGYV
ncbi:ketopantoate reductase family protein [Candidatus Viridilinea mediisalina]|uniref:Ketopantoate reductase N-terminal domain-containing protein n=1 Tax=Candidatus Viridilinea mediisalina TaxID=2024553 RepID=A0A2A6REU2_9CHLR|nr:2-dehydropantoate 2-reductase N-terminal domain-containing protein [Candidatus Viridilinea mediisalina]PDW01355.1 hypothetical protein CJ255_19320 [Candidatus Viridilinea mediisalina]